MDCSICTTLPVMLRPPRNTICGACYEGAKTIINLINKLEVDRGNAKTTTSPLSPPNTCKTLLNASKWVMCLKETEEELYEKISFFHGFVDAFRNRFHSDILLKPGDNGSPIASHRALLAARSKIFKNMLESDKCKAPPLETITLPELNHEELESLLEFLYSGSLPQEKLAKHVYPLSLAADKYEIIYLQKFCENYLLKTLKYSNALDVFEISDVCSFLALRDNTLDFIVKHMEDVVFSAEYENFALKNPHLSVQITRALLRKNKVS